MDAITARPRESAGSAPGATAGSVLDAEHLLHPRGRQEPALRPVCRVALVVSSYRQPEWISALLSQLAAMSGIEFTTVLLDEAPKTTFGQRAPMLYRAYRRLDAAIFRSQARALRMVVIKPVVSPLENFIADAWSRQKGDMERPLFDVLLDPAGETPAELADALAREVWTYGLTHSERIDSIFAQRLRGGKVATMALVSRGPSGSATLVGQTHTAIDRWSDIRTLSNCYHKAPAIIAGRLCSAKHEELSEISREEDGQEGGSNRQAACLVASLCGQYAKERVQRVFCRQQWGLAFTSIPELRRSGPSSFRPSHPPLDRFWADPFLVEHCERQFVFFEEFSYAAGKGRIMAAECDERGIRGEPVCVLDRPYHLSYPYIFSRAGGWYMIPETRGNHTIEVYTCTSFPRKWELCRTLFHDTDASDTTLALIGGRWWLFTNLGVAASAHDDLYLFHMEDPLGAWTPHRGNPVKSDARSGRSAGRIVIANENVYRLSQDCSYRYGYAINAHRITCLRPDSYAEESAGRMEPSPGSRLLLGVHTANNLHDLIVIDGLTWRSRLRGRADRNPCSDLQISGFDFWLKDGPAAA